MCTYTYTDATLEVVEPAEMKTEIKFSKIGTHLESQCGTGFV